MIRYRCPHCAALIVAHERRVGQSSVCKACLKSHQIPPDTALWLTESGELLHPPAAAEPIPAATAPDIDPLPVPARDEPDLSPTVPDLRLSEPEPILVDPSPEPAAPVTVAVAHEPAPEPVAAASASRSEARQPRPVVSTELEHAEQPEGSAVAVAELPVPSAPASAPRGRVGLPLPVPRAAGDTPPPVSGEPVQLQTQADIALALTAALTSRMKPPPAPRRDLRPSTAVWLLLTGAGVACLLVAVCAGAGDLVSGTTIAALAIGGVQISIGYAWIVRLTYLRNPKRGLACAVTPAVFYYLAQSKYARLRPLRFVLTGAVIVLLTAPPAHLVLAARALVRKDEAKPAPPPDPAADSRLARLRVHRDQRAYDPLVAVLDELANTDPLRSADAADRLELAAELKALCAHKLTFVRIEAMAAFNKWDPSPDAADARAVCLAAIRSPTQEERIRALQLLRRWKDAESARAVQSLIGRPGVETNQAKESLEVIGGAPAEQAALALLKRADDLATRLIAISILEKVGTAEAAKDLLTFAMATDDTLARARAQVAATAIDARTPKP